jgi:hypothetical protein
MQNIVLYEVSSNIQNNQPDVQPSLAETKSPQVLLNSQTLIQSSILKRKKFNSIRYVRFTKKQTIYLRSVFKENRRPTLYDDILLALHKLSYPGQILTEKKVWTFFKNERHRTGLF